MIQFLPNKHIPDLIPESKPEIELVDQNVPPLPTVAIISHSKIQEVLQF